MTLFAFAKRLLAFLHMPFRIMRARAALAKNAKLTPKDVFTEIYEKHLWSPKANRDTGADFFSGPGSDEMYGAPYAETVTAFVNEHKIDTIVDLGCGDFRVGRLLAGASARYIGVDVVEPLIERNVRLHSSSRVEFRCLDITTDALPDGDLCLAREVFQHLSNAQIAAVLRSLRKYRYCIVTDAQPSDIASFKPNLDKPSGAQSISFFRSGLRLDLPPFNLPNVSVFLDLPVKDEPHMVYRSFLISF